MSWRTRFVLGALLVFMAVSIIYANRLLTDRFTETTRSRAELRMALYTGNLSSELQRNAIVPQLLSRDPELISALFSNDYSRSTQRLISFVEEIGAASLMLLDQGGRAVAASDRARLGSTHNSAEYFVSAVRSNQTVFSTEKREAGGYIFAFSRRLEFQNETLGVIVVEVDLQKFQLAWANIADAVMVLDSEGTIILSTEPKWRGVTEGEALERQPATGAIERALRVTSDWTSVTPDAYLRGEAVLRVEGRVPFRGWRIASFTTYSSVREKVNGVLAIIITGFAILFALAFYLLSRRNASRMALFQRESVELRILNERLQSEITERERMQKSLEVAEQTLAQSSKLAALGEMSAAVSHELNQPLAAMKTYLAGAALLVRRNRPDESLAAFGRIDDLIVRMTSITKQLKSFAAKGGDDLAPVDLHDAIASSLSIMDTQIRLSEVKIEQILTDGPVMIMADRVRIEQVLINLIKNALDAVQGEVDPTIEILLSRGETAILSIRDNGNGINNLDDLFEPFFTTKQPGEGTGLGLAIASGIVTDLGGRLTARNGQSGGAVFEIQIPILQPDRPDTMYDDADSAA